MTTHVSVLVLTMQRPRLLGRLLDALEQLTFDGPPPAVEVIVVDNDPEGSARSLVEARAGRSRWTLRYLMELQRGIPFARNAALGAMSAQSEFVVFIDDDELPVPQWLQALLNLQGRLDADVVAGPVVSKLPQGSPGWATRGKVFDHSRSVTGAAIQTCGTGNVLIRRRVLDQVQPWFDERLALSGGSDRHFFLRLHQARFRMVWCDEALVYEEVPASRVRLQWVVKRMYRQGICNGFCDIDLKRYRSPRLRTGLLGVACIAGGLGLLPVAAAAGPHRAVQFVRYAAYGAGLLQACRGRLYQEYLEIHGS